MNRIERLYTIPYFSRTMSKLYEGIQITYEEGEYLLGCVIILLEEYDKTDERDLFELAYNIVLRYSLSSNDYEPLYDFSCNYGFYPTVAFINKKKLLKDFSIQKVLLGYQMERFRNDGYTETYEQNKTRKNIINSERKNIAFIAPTSSGKSSLIIQHLERHINVEKAVVIVPTKSLIAQTYMELRKNIHDRKIISHEGMYRDEKRFVGALTQERLLRLLEKYTDVKIDCLYVDEAHNIFGNDPRNILLSRAIKICKLRNPNLQVIYLSPFINDVNNLIMGDISEIDEQRITYSIKEPNIFVKNRDGAIEVYDRFSDSFLDVGKNDNPIEYIKNRGSKKNFVFLNKPQKIERFAFELYENTEPIQENEGIIALQKLLEKVVHPRFNVIKYLSHGIIYLHANIPEQIKEYLEYQFRINENIRYLIANSVIMEGINLPIDCLFICSTWQMTGSALQNLLGRVNRLNNVFSDDQRDLRKLIPEVHFVDVSGYTPKNQKMENLVRKAYGRTKDDVRNPLLTNCSLEDLKTDAKERAKKRNEEVLSQEKIYYSEPDSELEFLKKKVIVSGMNQLITVSDSNIVALRNNLNQCDYSMDIIDIVSYVFTRNIDVSDKAFKRLSSPAAIRFYKFFISQMKTGDLASLVSSQLEFQLNRSKENGPYMYVGPSYGEVEGWRDEYEHGQKVYVDVRQKSQDELINLLIVKTKVEQDFLGFQYNRAVNFLHDNEYISDERYNLEIYGTNDEHKIQLLNLGLSSSLLHVLDDGNQIQNITFDAHGNMIGNEKLKAFKSDQNAFTRYEIDKYIFFEK